MADTPTSETPPPLVVGQEGWYVPIFRGRLAPEGRRAPVSKVHKTWAEVRPDAEQTLHVVMATGAAYRNRKGDIVGRWYTEAGYALWLAKAAADSERGELVEALRVKGITVNSSVKTDVLPRLLAALGE